VWWLGGLPPLRVGDQLIELGLPGDVLGVLGIVWTLNLFNFMDGIDGIAASESAFICVVAAAIMGSTGALSSELVATVLLGAASLGFLWWNWPRARIFMGDAGSGFLGFGVAALAIAHARHEPVALFVWTILGATFIADSGVTLLRRLLRGLPVYQAHRTHAYQRLTDRFGGHRPVTLAFMAVNVGSLLPCAIIAWTHPSWAAALAGLALLPLVIAALLLGAGR
jgi:Fuc2NAc and GlcNAc transferase